MAPPGISSGSRMRHHCGALDDLRNFLDEGEAPVCVGWAPMLGSSVQTTWLVVNALKQLRLRGVVIGGSNRGGLKGATEVEQEALDEYLTEHVLIVESAPLSELLSRCRMVIHPGSSEMTEAALKSGTPAVIAPCVKDEVRNAERVRNAGCGVMIPTLHEVTMAQLASAIEKCCSDRLIRQRCNQMRLQLQVQQKKQGQRQETRKHVNLKMHDTGSPACTHSRTSSSASISVVSHSSAPVDFPTGTPQARRRKGHGSPIHVVKVSSSRRKRDCSERSLETVQKDTMAKSCWSFLMVAAQSIGILSCLDDELYRSKCQPKRLCVDNC